MDQADRDFFAANGFINLGKLLEGEDLEHFRAMFDADMEQYPTSGTATATTKRPTTKR